MTIATPEDVSSRWVGTSPPTDDELVQALLDDAETIIHWAIPDLDQRLATDPAMPSRVRIVETRMVTRALKNPDGVRQQLTVAGPYTEQVMYASETFTGLWLDKNELAMLTRAAGRRRQTAFTVSPIGQKRQHPLAGALINGPDWLAPGYQP